MSSSRPYFAMMLVIMLSIDLNWALPVPLADPPAIFPKPTKSTKVKTKAWDYVSTKIPMTRATRWFRPVKIGDKALSTEVKPAPEMSKNAATASTSAARGIAKDATECAGGACPFSHKTVEPKAVESQKAEEHRVGRKFSWSTPQNEPGQPISKSMPTRLHHDPPPSQKQKSPQRSKSWHASTKGKEDRTPSSSSTSPFSPHRKYTPSEYDYEADWDYSPSPPHQRQHPSTPPKQHPDERKVGHSTSSEITEEEEVVLPKPQKQKAPAPKAFGKPLQPIVEDHSFTADLSPEFLKNVQLHDAFKTYKLVGNAEKKKATRDEVRDRVTGKTPIPAPSTPAAPPTSPVAPVKKPSSLLGKAKEKLKGVTNYHKKVKETLNAPFKYPKGMTKAEKLEKDVNNPKVAQKAKTLYGKDTRVEKADSGHATGETSSSTTRSAATPASAHAKLMSARPKHAQVPEGGLVFEKEVHPEAPPRRTLKEELRSRLKPFKQADREEQLPQLIEEATLYGKFANPSDKKKLNKLIKNSKPSDRRKDPVTV